jgi:hypothetical protein
LVAGTYAWNFDTTGNMIIRTVLVILHLICISYGFLSAGNSKIAKRLSLINYAVAFMVVVAVEVTVTV